MMSIAGHHTDGRHRTTMRCSPRRSASKQDETAVDASSCFIGAELEEATNPSCLTAPAVSNADCVVELQSRIVARTSEHARQGRRACSSDGLTGVRLAGARAYLSRL